MINSVNFYAIQLQSRMMLDFEGRRSHHVKKNYMTIGSIRKRMCMHNFANRLRQPALVNVNVDKFDDIYSGDIFYLPEGYHDELCDNVVAFISSGKSIESPYMELSEENGELKINCIDGRHRYRVLKNMGMKIMPMTMSQDSVRLAKKHGLIAIDFQA